ncbi:3212_t:CDS:2 [Cetraspora pellucida]|uniref:Mitochondrial import inner membrane translocase subunit Tim21 n=1 Tax=Cetraspora pellucida TaxID=1433469 RepID=A0A9N9NGY7_9GLOM|nr:3212_t:CDS:2 [Cetraspora pellucida]
MISTILHQRTRFVNSSLNTSLFKCKFHLTASILTLKQLDIIPVRCRITNSLLNKRNHSYKALNYFNKLSLDGKRRYQTNSLNLRKVQRSKDIIERKKVKEWGDLSTRQKVAKAAKTTTNISVIVIGVGVLGIILYYIVSELFGPKSSTKVFNESLEKIRNNQECQKFLGTPIKGHGIPVPNSRLRNPRARLRDVINTDGTPHRIMQFYVEGPLTNGNALLDMIKDNQGNWVIKYLVVTVHGYGKRIYIEYNDDVNDKEK